MLLCLFCGSSLGFFSVKADTVPSYSPSVYGDYNSTDGFINAEVRVVSFNPYYEDFHFTNYRDFEPHYTGIVKQDYFISVTLRNRTNTDATCANNFFGALTLSRNNITLPPSSEYHYTFACESSGWSIKELSSNIATIYIGGGDSSANTIQIIPTSDLFDGPQCAIPANSKITFYMILTNTLAWKAYTNNDGNYLLNVSVFPRYSDRPITSINYNVNQSWQQSSQPIRYQQKVIEGIEDQLIIANAQLNDIKNNQVIAHSTEVIQNQLMDTLINNQTDQQNEISSNITDQTQQQQENYDAFSANTDASDSSNISSTISGGTDAVKEKMGLFSFFDGIVSDLSDVLTKNHERHLVLPALDVPLPEETVHIWDRKEFDFEELENNFGAILTVVRFATVAICYVTMINGAYHLFHKFIGVKDSDA